MTAASQTISDEQLQGIIVVGIDDHEMLNARIASLSTMEFGYTPPIYLVETDISRARDSAIALGLGSSTAVSRILWSERGPRVDFVIVIAHEQNQYSRPGLSPAARMPRT